MGSDFMDNLRVRINETSEALRVYAERADSGSKDVATGISTRVSEVTEMLNGVLDSATNRRNP